MQHDKIQQEEQIFVIYDDVQHFIREISALRSLAEEVGIAGHLLEELDIFKHEIEYLDSSVWERKEVKVLNRDELVRLSLAVLRAFGSRKC